MIKYKLINFTFFLIAFSLISINSNAQCFSKVPNIDVKVNSPYSLVSADFDGDGNVDIATANYNSNNVTILLGTGASDFSSSNTYSVDKNPRWIISTDINGDGKLDLVTANSNSSSISVLIGNGSGGFSLSIPFYVTGNPYCVVSADFNGDGKIDLATADYSANCVSILLGNGSGNFSTASYFSVSPNPYSLTVSDFNGDGKMDIATANSTSNNVSVLIGNGSGGFATKVNYNAGSSPRSVISRDFNADGKIDLMVANYYSTNVSLLLGTGSGSFSAPTNFSIGSYPNTILSADFNGDGKMDVAAIGGIISVLISNGSGGFTNTDYNTGIGASQGITFGDYNGDGKIDLVAASQANLLGLVILINGGVTGFLSPKYLSFGMGNKNYSIIDDFNGDGKMDIATNQSSGAGSILLNDGTGHFLLAKNFFGQSPSCMTSADFNGDGKKDIACVSGSNPTSIDIYLGNGNGSFSSYTSLNYNVSTYSITNGDFNGDGKIDIAVLSGNGVLPFFGTGTGTFSQGTGISVGTSPIFITSADFNGDGKKDLITTNLNSANVSVILANNSGGFLVASNFAVGLQPRSIAISDLNSDGKLDIAVANQTSSNISVLFGNGLGGFTLSNTYSVPISLNYISSGDINGDGRPDLIVNNNLMILLSNDSGGFLPATYGYLDWANLSTGGNINVADFNGDGRMDIQTMGDSLYVLINKGLILGITSLNVSPCSGGKNGSATISVIGGIPPYRISWNTIPPQTSQTATGLSAGTYLVTVTDTMGCSNFKYVTITEPTPLILNFNTTNVSCNGGNNGSIGVNVTSNGTPPYTYLWSTMPPQTSQIATGLIKGDYTVTVTDATNRCSKSQIITVNQPPPLSATFTSSTINVCSGTCLGSCTLSVSGGKTPYNYLWDASAGNQTTATATNLCAGSYVVIIKDSNGCSFTKTVSIVPTSKVNPEVYVSNIAAVDKVNADPSFTAFYNYDLPSNITSNSTNPKNYVDPGKFVRFKIQSANHKSNGLSMVNGHCIIRSSDPNITITDSLSNLNNIAYNDSAWSTDEFEIFIKPSTPDGANIYVDFIVEENGIQWATTCVAIPIHPLVYSPPNSNTVNDDNNGDSHGNNDGICDKGETIEFYPFLNSITNLNASYVRGRLSNLDNLSYINIWNNHAGISGTVYNASWWNFAFGVPAQIPAGQKNMGPEFDFVFDYSNPNVATNFKLHHVLAGGFKLFKGNALSLVQWTIPYTFNGTGGVGVNSPEVSDKEFIISPNPNNGIFLITTKVKGSTFEITNMLGEKIYSRELNSLNEEVDLSKHAKGMYFYQLISNNKILGSGKIIVD